MPNHVTNIMTVNGPAEAVAELKAAWFHAGSPDQKSSPELPDMVVDFNALLPQPEGMDIEHGSVIQCRGLADDERRLAFV
ncbi:hypothetical protein ACFPVS_02765 [Neisseria weixii]